MHPGPPPGMRTVTTGARLVEEVEAMPQRAWSAKRERQYEHIKEGLEQHGRSEDVAEEIAARTVNKERARAGESREASRTSVEDISSGRRGGLRSHRGSGGRTKARLYEAARRKDVHGRSSMTKAERRNPGLLNASRKRRVAAGSGTEVQEINRLLKMHRQMADMMKTMARQKGGGLLGKLFGGGMPEIPPELANNPEALKDMLPKGGLPHGGLPGLGAGGMPKLPGLPGLPGGRGGFPGGLPGLPGGKKKK